jgi:CheY-like chemotaxis protein
VSAPRVLVVDDNPLNLELASFVLRAGGFAVDSAPSALSALERIAQCPPRAILMDIQMPGMDGLALTRHIKADPSLQHITVIAFTAFAMKGDEARLRAAGCDAYLSKPIDVATFASSVRRCLQLGGGTA